MKMKFIENSYQVNYNLYKMKPMQISIWNGFVMGGGVGLTQNSPIRIATENTIWAMP
jgi:3-hydroxyisobutyryl-CoA hydrolase